MRESEEPARLDYFPGGEIETSDEIPLSSKRAVWAILCATGAVTGGIWLGLWPPRHPTARELACVGLCLAGLAAAGLGGGAIWQLRKQATGHIDRSLAIFSVVLGLLCVVAGVVMFYRRQG